MILTQKETKPRRKHDLYPTPPEFVQYAYTLLPKAVQPHHVLDIGAGDGVWGRELARLYPEVQLTGVEIRDVSPAPPYRMWYTGDISTFRAIRDTPYDFVVGNWPFNIAEQCVWKAYELLRPGGSIFTLLPLRFLASQTRFRTLWKTFPPQRVYVSSRRISFDGTGKTDDTEYALYYWTKGFTGLTILDWFIWETADTNTPLSSKKDRGKSAQKGSKTDILLDVNEDDVHLLSKPRGVLEA